MSLHQLAQHVQKAGRGEDTVLIHMTPKEVNGLQSLAMAHGGSLTINPETGLAEAGFLSSILPMIAGVGLTVASGGALSPLMAAGLVGGGTALATGSLQKGLMAGLGAYGGAGLGAGLMAQGAGAAAAAAPNAAQTAITGYADDAAAFAKAGSNPFSASQAFNPAASKSIMFNGTQANAGLSGFPTYAQTQGNILASPTLQSAPSVVPPVTPAPVVSAPTSGPMSLDSYIYDRPGFTGLESLNGNPNVYTLGDPTSVTKLPFNQAKFVAQAQLPESGAAYTDLLRNQGANSASVIPTSSAAGNVSSQGISRPFTDRMAQLGRGIENSSSIEGLKGLYKAMPMGSVVASGTTLASALTPEAAKERKEKALIRPYDFTYGATNVASEPYTGSGERIHFNPVFTARTPYEAPGPEYAASGGLMGYAVGGPVEQMSAQNAVAANHTYPQSQIETSMYTNPMVQRPVSNNVITSGIDAPIDPYTGEARFAKGGTTGGYKYDYNPQTQQFTQTAAPKPKPTGFLSPLMDEISARTNVYGGGSGGARAGRWDESLRDSPGLIGQLYRKQNPEPVQQAPIVTGGMAPQTQQQPMYQPQQAAPIPAYQSPEQQLGLTDFYNYMNQQLGQGYAGGGNVGGGYNLGGYSDGGRLLKGPGDGVSDSIPAVIGNRQPARLADGEFVVPARIVSELGNGSTEAGARKLYAMMERVQKARRKTVGKNQVAKNTRSERLLPA
jgi:hypothetical protein